MTAETRWTIAATLAATFWIPVQAADLVTPGSLESLDEVVVKGQALSSATGAFTATAMDQQQIREERVSQMQQLFKLVPGMNVLDYGLPGVGNAIVMRGFGGGGHGGDLGTAIDGIPLNEAMSHADGYVDFGVIVPLEMQRMSVHKGPSSPLYGNFNRSGLVDVTTRKGGSYAEADLSGGNDQTLDAQLALGIPLGTQQTLNLAGQAYRSDGFRPQSDNERITLAGRWGIALDSGVNLAVAARVHAADADSPSYLSASQFAIDPYGIDPRVQNDGADKNFGTLRVDANHALNERLKLLGFAYTTRQDFTRWFSRPVNTSSWRQREETYGREVYGAGTSLNGNAGTNRNIQWVAGIEAFREATGYEYYDGLDQRARVTPAINDRRARLDSVSAFGQVEAPLHRLFMPSIGFRADRFTGQCSLQGPETSTSPCGRLNTMEHFSPKIGIHAQPFAALALRASWSEGFALPAGFVKYAASAASLQPNVFRQTELGMTLQPHATINLDVAAFRIESTNEVRQLLTGQFDNFGRTLRHGLEASLDWRALDSLQFTAIYGLTDSEIKQNASPALVGKQVAGVSDHTGTFTARWSPLVHWSLDASLRYVGGFPIDAANSESSRSYTTLDLGGSLALRRRENNYRLFLNLENVTDKTYAASYSRIGGVTVLAPAMPRTVRAGLQFDL